MKATPEIEVTKALGFAALLTVAVEFGGRFFPTVSDVLGLVLALGLIQCALFFSDREKNNSNERFDLGVYGLFAPRTKPWSRLGRELRFTAWVTAVVLSLSVPGAYLVFKYFYGTVHPWRWGWPPGMLNFTLSQLMFAALPEEMFFRGYLYTRLGDIWPKTKRILGADVSLPAMLISSTCFAGFHVFSQPFWWSVFFPGLLFAWMKSRGGLLSAILFHALSNVFAEIVQQGWFR